MSVQYLRLVLSRRPVPLKAPKNNPNYRLCYVIETLECGHEMTVYPQADPLIAKRRNCLQCANPTRKVKKAA